MRRHRSPSPGHCPRFSCPSSPPSSTLSISPISQLGRSLSRSRSPRDSPLSRTSLSDFSRDDMAFKRRTKESNDTSGPSSPPPWEYDPNYGIVHLSSCSICRAYITHMAEASYPISQPSFQLALKDRDSKHDAYFFDGVREGRRRQHHDNEHLFRDVERYRAERNQALDALRAYKSKCTDVREELSCVKDKLRAYEADCDKLRQRVEVLSGGKQDQNSQAARSETLEVERALLSTERRSENITPEGAPKVPQDPVATSALVQPPGALDLADMPLAPTAPTALLRENCQQSASSTSIFPSTFMAAASDRPSQPSATESRATSTHSKNIQPSLPPTPAVGRSALDLPAHPTTSMPRCSSADLRSTLVPTNMTSAVGRNPKSIRQLQLLMNAAHIPGNDGALAKVKALCAEAHQTPREHKTDLQRFILSNWRNPSPAVEHNPHASLAVLSSHQQPPTITNPRMEDPVEVWYAYLSTYPGSWPRGVRRDSRGRPRFADLKASRTVARLRPEVDVPSNTASRSEFMSCVARLFAEPGMYKEQLERSAFRVAPAVSYQPYRGPPNITIEEVVRHFANCGITATEATQELEPWAQEYQASGGVATESDSSVAQQFSDGKSSMAF